jgi:DNA polymerase III subunit delta
LQLAEAIKDGDVRLTVQVLHLLLARAEAPLVILATLLTQFRTWLWVKCALRDRTQRKDTEIAQLCGLGNPKRLYYLRQQLSRASVADLTKAVIGLFELETALKQGANPGLLMPGLVQIATLFTN